jgi:hypothetical protein
MENKINQNNDSKSNRESALEWWNNLPFNSNNTIIGKTNYTIKYYGFTRKYTDLTGREIEEIWLKEKNYLQKIPTT